MNRLDELSKQTRDTHKQNMQQLAQVYNECMEFLKEIKSMNKKVGINK